MKERKLTGTGDAVWTQIGRLWLVSACSYWVQIVLKSQWAVWLEWAWEMAFLSKQLAVLVWLACKLQLGSIFCDGELSGSWWVSAGPCCSSSARLSWLWHNQGDDSSVPGTHGLPVVTEEPPLCLGSHTDEQVMPLWKQKSHFKLKNDASACLNKPKLLYCYTFELWKFSRLPFNL